MIAPTNETRHADAVGPALRRAIDAVRSGDQRLHRLGVFVAEVEHLADLDPARRDASILGRLDLEAGRVVHVLGRGVERRPLLDDAGEVALVIHRLWRDRQGEHVLVDEHAGFARLGEHDELVG